ncbi:hypothetical protein DL98DRAFT_511371 [Cadophora sp. DSE1049]|nr:hypothetical protein DL98DRAFT_511371 [Cadophora sp. DSE1049]
MIPLGEVTNCKPPKNQPDTSNSFESSHHTTSNPSTCPESATLPSDKSDQRRLSDTKNTATSPSHMHAKQNSARKRPEIGRWMG